MATPINYRDPRFQKAMLRAHGDPTKNATGISEQLTSGFASQQLGVQNQFNQLKAQKDRFDSGMKFRNKQLKTRRNIFKRELSDAKSANKIGLYGGVGTTMVASLIGMSNRKKLLAEASDLKKFRTSQTELISKQSAILDSIMKGKS